MIDTLLTVPLVDSKLFDSPEPRRVFDIERMAYLIAAHESAQFFNKHMRLAKNLITPSALLEFALLQRDLEGLTLEFGVATGATLRVISQATMGRVYGFDSFEGLPEDWTHFQKTGRFSSDGIPPDGIPANAEIFVGYFNETLPEFIASKPGVASFIHIDCDLYSSTKFVLEQLSSRLVAGTVIVFDEYLNYPGWHQHEHKAFSEYIATSDLEPEYLGFSSSGQSVAVRLAKRQNKG